MLIAAVIAICVPLLLLAFLAPRLSRHPERGVQRGFGAAARTGSKAPGPLGRWLSKPARTSQKAASKSAETGRKGRREMPF